MFFNVNKKVYPILIYYFVRRVYDLSEYHNIFLIHNLNLMKLMKQFYFFKNQFFKVNLGILIYNYLLIKYYSRFIYNNLINLFN